MKLKINISPCPNDTFMFHAMLHGLVDTEGVDFEPAFGDIEELNRTVLASVDGNEKKKDLSEVGFQVESTLFDQPHISKISSALLPNVYKHYALCPSGSALGRGNGPLLVSRHREVSINTETRVAVPGLHTTANSLMDILYPQVKLKTPVLFSEIADRVSGGGYDMGVLIHEGRFTYADNGLSLVADLGLEWERKTGLALPLGSIVIDRTLDRDISDAVNRIISRSVAYASANPEDSRPFVKQYAREMDDDVIDKHIAMFVNEYSVDLGHGGWKAVEAMTGIEKSLLI